MQLAILLVVVCAVSAVSTGEPLPAAVRWQVPAALLLLLAAPLAAMMARMSLERALRSGRIDCRRAVERWEAWHEVIAWIWGGSALVMLVLGQWPDVVRSASWTLAWPLADELLILAPLVASLLVVWSACWRVMPYLRARWSTGSPSARAGAPGSSSKLRHTTSTWSRMRRACRRFPSWTRISWKPSSSRRARIRNAPARRHSRASSSYSCGPSPRAEDGACRNR